MRWEEINEARAWHGSPHRFEVFDIEKVNTGEGNQAYGWGLYFAQEPKVADYYRKALNTITYRGEEPDEHTMDAIRWLLSHNWNVEDAVEDAGSNMEAAIRSIDPKEVQFTGGHTYEVEIPGDETFLNWNEDFSQQSAIVKKALRALARKSNPTLKRYIGDCIKDDDTGKIIYAHIGNYMRNEKRVPFDSVRQAVSELLSQAGITGVKYLDAYSLNQEEKTLNYVVFRAEDIQIVSQTDH